MARKPRIHFNGAVYHVLLRGLEGKPVFRNVADRREWESLVAEGVERFDHKILGFCWMPDHVQLAIEVANVPLSRVMQNLSFRYTRYYNSQHGEDGPLFHGRYKAILIDPDAYLTDLVAYIHNNPVRAGKAKKAADYKWSSHASYVGKDDRDWVSTERCLEQFGKTARKSMPAFSKHVDAARADGFRRDLERGADGGRLLGDAKFMRRALKPAKPVKRPMTLNQLVKLVCREEGVKEADLKSDSRARRESAIRQTITYLAMEYNVANLTAMADRFNRDLTTMSRNQRYFRDRLNEDSALQKHVRALGKQVSAG